MASFRTVSISTTGWDIDLSSAVPGTLSVVMPELDEFEIPVIIDKPLEAESLTTHGLLAINTEPEPTPEDLQARYQGLGIKVRDYAYAGPVKSAVVPETAVPANFMFARAFASAGIDPNTREEVSKEEIYYPLDPVPEIFNPYNDIALYDLIMREREEEKHTGISKLGSIYGDSIEIEAREVPIPGKILYRLIREARWLTNKDQKRWLPVDWESLRVYVESGSAVAQPFRTLQMSERKLPPHEELLASVVADFEKANAECPPSPRARAAQTRVLEMMKEDPTPPAPTRGGNWVHADGRLYSSSEYARTLVRQEYPDSSAAAVIPTPRYKHTPGVTGDIPDGVGESLPNQTDRKAILESRAASVTILWDCLRRSWADKKRMVRRVRRSNYKAENAKALAQKRKVPHSLEEKLAPKLKRRRDEAPEEKMRELKKIRLAPDALRRS